MKSPIYLLCILFSCSLFAQEKSVDVNDDSKFQIGITGSADVAYRTLLIIEDHPLAQFNIDYRNNDELQKLGYSGGLNFSYLLNEQIFLSCGLQYSNMGYKTKPIALSFGVVDPRRGFIYEGEASELHYVFSFHYVELPVSFQYQFGENKFKPLISIGLSPGYLTRLTRTSVWNYLEGGKSRERNQLEFTSLERLSLTPFANMGLNYQINEAWSFQASVQFRYNLFTVFDEPISTNLWNAGLQLGCFYKL